MYWKSKKKVYGIDNELHLTCMKVLFKSSKNETIKHEDIINIFEQEIEGDNKSKTKNDFELNPLKYNLP